jgi:hypothetical protein
MRIDPWNFAHRGGLLIPNPRASKPLPPIELGTAELKIEGETYKRIDGQQMSELLGLPPNWPEQ